MTAAAPSAAAPTLADVLAARRRGAGLVQTTPLIGSRFFSGLAGAELLLKLDCVQTTGSFKIRGAANAVGALPPGTAGVVCCSTGNHGRAVATAAQRAGLRAVVCLSEATPLAKREGVRAAGAELRVAGDDFAGQGQEAAQAEATRLAAAEGLVEISPFDDPFVIAGQGTIALELLETRPDLATILVPLSGGGLAGGIALAAKAIKPSIRIIGASMAQGAAMAASIAAGRVVDPGETPSLADALTGPIGPGNRWSFDLCRRLLDDVALVQETEIYRALQAIYFEDGIVCEGACVTGLAALTSGAAQPTRPPGPIAAVITGRNIDTRRHAAIMRGENVSLGDPRAGGLTVPGRPYHAADRPPAR